MNKKEINEQLQIASDTDMSFLNNLSEKIIDVTHTVDTHANIMIGINTAIFAFVVSKLFEVDTLRITMGIVAIFSACSALAAVSATRLPHFFSKTKHEKSILHAPRIAQFNSANEYAGALKKMTQSKDETFRQHALEVYNMSKYYYLPKRRMLAWSRYFFVFGVMLSGMFLLLEKLHWFIY
ncbi:MAG: DUF5706 domain-containing protein [Patescibacteria group bacterium]|nr:DUF5706 domain-containing protein [Patescibacteria group bacterium]